MFVAEYVFRRTGPHCLGQVTDRDANVQQKDCACFRIAETDKWFRKHQYSEAVQEGRCADCAFADKRICSRLS